MMKANSQNIDDGFEPILGNAPKILVLGTMPSVQSLQSQEYYGNPRNAFWWIMSVLNEFNLALTYPERVQVLMDRHIAVWDVVASCYRPGSLDSNIDQSTVKPNGLAELLEAFPSIRLIAFNGQAAEKLFKKFIDNAHWQGDRVVLPSTSPANAMLKREDKLKKWSIINDYLTD